MEIFFTPTAIIAATLSGFFFGFIWYSPFLCMRAWMFGEGITEAPKRSKKYIAISNLYSLVAHGCMTSVLALMFSLLNISSLESMMSLGLLLAFGFIVTTRFIDMIYTVQGFHYEKRSQIKFLVSSGYYLSAVSVISFVLYLFV
jgi:Protein of unknown function (DUF1761)